MKWNESRVERSGERTGGGGRKWELWKEREFWSHLIISLSMVDYRLYNFFLSFLQSSRCMRHPSVIQGCHLEKDLHDSCCEVLLCEGPAPPTLPTIPPSDGPATVPVLIPTLPLGPYSTTTIPSTTDVAGNKTHAYPQKVFYKSGCLV